MKIQEKKAQKNSANKTMSKDCNTSNKYLFLKQTKKGPEKEGCNCAKQKIIIIKLYTLNSGNARRDDKIVSTVNDRGEIQ